MKKRILVVEDDEHLAMGLSINLELEGYEPLLARSAEEGQRFWEEGGLDLILLDVMLPGMDGFAFCKMIRAKGDRLPILFLTARNRDEDRIRGLEEGGDDYLPKPFNLRELLARIKGLFRREDWFRSQAAPEFLDLGRCRINLRTFEAVTPRGSFSLKEKEAMILRLLAEHQGEPVARNTILDRVWGFDAHPSPRTVDNFILNLRKIVEEDPAAPERIVSVHGVGYRLVL